MTNLKHNVVSSTPRLNGIQIRNVSGDSYSQIALVVKNPTNIWSQPLPEAFNTINLKKNKPHPINISNNI
jgi:hypothetical protein